jgi:hypothetical protein
MAKKKHARKGITGSVFAIVGGAIALFIGLWVISLVMQSVSQASWTSTANSTYTTVTTTVFNAFGLLAVGLIVLAAAVIISYFAPLGGGGAK